MTDDATAGALSCQRHRFTLPAGTHYLNCAYMGPLPRSAQEAGIEGVRRKGAPADITAQDFFTGSDEARRRFGELIGGEAGRVAIIPSASYGIATVAHNTRLEPGRNVVVLGEQFPSNVYPWRKLAQRSGAQVRTVHAPVSANRGEAWNAALLDAIDERTALVAVPQVHWTDGTRFDLVRAGEQARRVGAALVIDGTQSIGAHPFDVRDIRPDAVICAAYKWLLGPYSMGFAWYGARYDDGEPIEEGWIARQGSADFRALVNYRDEYAPGAVRYDVGERSNFILIPMTNAALDCVLEWGPARIQAYCSALTADLIAEAEMLGFRVESAAWRGAHLFGLRAPPHIDRGALQTELNRRNVSVSLRGSAVRIAPNVYNDEDDVAALLDALRAAVTGRATAAAAPSADRAAPPSAR